MYFIFSEGELEEVLTTYTKINKSASIFLGGNPKHSSSESNRATPQGRPPSGTSQKSTAGKFPIIVIQLWSELFKVVNHLFCPSAVFA